MIFLKILRDSLLVKTSKYVTDRRKINMGETSWKIINGMATLEENLRK
jgi:hypothetical protein